MEILTATFARTRRVNLGNFEHDERKCELTARVDAGESVETVLARLFELVGDAIAGEYADETNTAPSRETINAVEAYKASRADPDLTVALDRGQIDAAIAASAKEAAGIPASNDPGTPPVEPAVLTEEVFRAELALLAKTKGASAIVNALKARNIERAGQVAPADRQAFLDSVRG